MLAINPAIFWKLLYKTITKVLKTGQSKGNLRYKLLEILRGHTQEVIIIILFLLDFKNSSSFDLNSSVLLINNFNFSFVTSLAFEHLAIGQRKSTGTVATFAQGDLNISLKKQALGTEDNKSFITINTKISS